MKVDWVVIGAGFAGATFAERMARAGKSVRVLERRSHIGGNAYDEHNDRQILVHRYGPHIFHTNSAFVWNYLSRFTAWRQYEHRVLGLVDGHLVPIPFNLDSLAALFPPTQAARIQQALIRHYGYGKRVSILKLRESDDLEIRQFADYVYCKVFVHYTFKQWQLRPDQLSPSVTARVPISISHDDRYFTDAYQAMPRNGYASLFGSMLNHPNIDVVLSCDSKEVMTQMAGMRVLFTGAIDELMEYRFGPLPYRSLRFEEHTLDKVQQQPVAVINYPNDHDYTRVTEIKFLTGQQAPITTLITEFPKVHEPGKTIAYYPIPRDENKQLYARYLEAARIEYPEVLFAGRLADYQYYNMDQACARAIKLASDHGGPSWSQE
jgi:UDP-galactopyranose mutase